MLNEAANAARAHMARLLPIYFSNVGIAAQNRHFRLVAADT
jgi:hypothetical protein